MPRIFDCCMSAGRGDADLIQIRLHELEPVVDTFVIVEANRTHAGESKEFGLASLLDDLCLSMGMRRSRVRVIEVKDMPAGADPWARERHQRECIWRGLGDAQPDDLMIFSDCDEIPSRDATARYRPEMDACKFDQLNCYYWLNCVGGGWGGSIIAPVWWMRGQALSSIRNHSVAPGLLADGGWHFSFLGGVAAVQRKLRSYAHQECNQPHFLDERWLRVAINTPLDLFRRGCEFRFRPAGSWLPKICLSYPERTFHLVRDVAFHEYWIPDEQLCWLVDTFRRVVDLKGDVVEFGCWEGRSTIALANMCFPDPLDAVDTWRGNLSEGPNHATETILKTRDVRRQFIMNVGQLTGFPGNVVVHEEDCLNYLESNTRNIRFAHVDAAHDYPSVRETILQIQECLVKGGVICGDDFCSAGAGRTDLQGGVERAVRETCPGVETMGNFWVFQKR